MNDPILRPSSRPQPAAFNRRSGLTVLELVSALALFVIVLGTLMVALNAATDIWSRNASTTRATQAARRVLDLLATDLAGAVGHKPADTASAPSANEINADDPSFIAEQKSDYQTGIFFVRQRSPLEVSGERALSLELVAYCWTTNGLSRYAAPVVSSDPDRIDPPVPEQLKAFRTDVFALLSATNLVAPSVVAFVPLVYKPTSALITPSDSLPADPLNKTGEKVQMADLPDYVDVFLACADRQAASAFSVTNYLTSRITLPAAQASRLP